MSYIEKHILRQKELKDFFETDEFNRIFNVVKKEKLVSEEKLRYKESLKDKGVTHEQFSKLHNSIFKHFRNELSEDNEGNFPVVYCIYKDVKFGLMIGQGSSMWTETND